MDFNPQDDPNLTVHCLPVLHQIGLIEHDELEDCNVIDWLQSLGSSDDLHFVKGLIDENSHLVDCECEVIPQSRIGDSLYHDCYIILDEASFEGYAFQSILSNLYIGRTHKAIYKTIIQFDPV